MRNPDPPHPVCVVSNAAILTEATRDKGKCDANSNAVDQEATVEGLCEGILRIKTKELEVAMA